MAQLPDTYSRRPTPKFGGVDQALPVVPTGEVQLGQAYMGLGSTVMQAANRIQAKQDKADLDNSLIQYKDGLNTLNNEYRQVRSGDVDSDFEKQWMDKHAELTKQVREEVRNQRIADALDRSLQMGEVNFREGLINHATEQMEVYRTQTKEGKIAVAKSTMASNVYNDGVLGQARDDIIDAVNDLADPLGIEGDALEAFKLKHLSDGHVAVINTMIADGNLIDAQEYFDDFNGSDPDLPNEIDGEAHGKIRHALKTASQEQYSIQYSDRLFDTKPIDMTDAEFKTYGEEWIRNNVPDQYRDATMTRFLTRIGQNETNQKMLQEEAGDSFYDQWNGFIKDGLDPMEAFNSVDPLTKGNMNPKALTAAYNMAKQAAQGQSVHTDFKAWNHLYTLATGSPEQKDQFLKEDLNEYVDRISTAHLMAFKKMQEDPLELKMASTMADIKNRLAEQINVEKLEASDLLDDELVSFQNRNKRTATLAETKEIANSKAADILFKRQPIWVRSGPPPRPMRWILGDFERKVFEADIEGIPNTEVDEYYREVLRLKEDVGDETPVTEADIIYLHQKYNPDSKTRKLTPLEIQEITGQ